MPQHLPHKLVDLSGVLEDMDTSSRDSDLDRFTLSVLQEESTRLKITNECVVWSNGRNHKKVAVSSLTMAGCISIPK